jgi:hypothetical protein
MLTPLPSSCADYLKILTTFTSCRPKGLPRPVHGLFSLLGYDAASYARKSKVLLISLRKLKHSLAWKASFIYARIPK